MIFYEEILKEFQKQNVKYLIVGGMALNFYGGSRNTFDLDIIAELSDANLSKIVNILKEKKYRTKIPVDPMGIAKKETRHDWIKNKNMKALNFYNKNTPGEVNLVIDTPVTYDQAKKRQKTIKIGSLKIYVMSIDDLIKMKKSAGRPWETDKERILRGMKISPRKKMEWLREMNEFMAKASSKKVLKIRQRLRELGAR